MRGAFEVASETSVDSLSMPVLAERLDVGVTSIYWYFRKKDRLLDAMTEIAASGYATALMPVPRDQSWAEVLRQHFARQHAVLVGDPTVADLLMTRTSVYSEVASRSIFTVVEAVLTVLIEQGFTPEDALRAYNTMSVYTRGVVLQNRGGADDDIAFGLGRLVCGFEALLAERGRQLRC